MEDIEMRLEELIAETRRLSVEVAHITDEDEDWVESIYEQLIDALNALKGAYTLI